MLVKVTTLLSGRPKAASWCDPAVRHSQDGPPSLSSEFPGAHFRCQQGVAGGRPLMPIVALHTLDAALPLRRRLEPCLILSEKEK